jgi:protein TonB
MDFSMRFTPDLGVGGGSGVAVAGEKIGTMVFDESDVDVPPRPISRMGVDYPRRAREAGIEGTVSLVLVISRTGKVTDVSIEHSPSQLFNNPVIQTVRQWKFEPAQKGGVAVQVRMRQNISFKLDR